MFILDSLFISGFRWVLNTVATAADAEMDDDTALREELLAAEMRREMGEISNREFAEIETDLLARIREIKARRDGGSGPIAFAGGTTETGADTQIQVEATVSGDFHESVHHSGGLGANRTTRTEGTTRTKGTSGTSRTTRTSRTSRTPRSS